GRGARFPGDCAEAAAGGDGGNLRRPPHGHEPGPGGTSDPGRGGSQSAMRYQELPRLLAGVRPPGRPILRSPGKKKAGPRPRLFQHEREYYQRSRTWASNRIPALVSTPPAELTASMASPGSK